MSFEEQTVKSAMIQCSNNISEAAKLLGISRPTLYPKLKTYRIIKE